MLPNLFVVQARFCILTTWLFICEACLAIALFLLILFMTRIVSMRIYLLCNQLNKEVKRKSALIVILQRNLHLKRHEQCKIKLIFKAREYHSSFGVFFFFFGGFFWFCFFYVWQGIKDKKCFGGPVSIFFFSPLSISFFKCLFITLKWNLF